MQDSEISLNLGLLEKKKQKTSGTKVVSFLALFKYADKKDKILMGVGSVTSMGAGVAMPFFMIFFSSLAEVFSADSGSITQKALDIAIKFFIIGGALWLLSFIGLYCWGLTGTRQAARFKKLYYQTLLSQEVAWYDSNDVNKLSTQISGNMVAIESAMGQKMSILLMAIITSIFGFFYAFIKCWRMSLILTGFLPVMMVAGMCMMKAMQFKAEISKVSYEGASGVAEQAFGAIKTVKSFVAETFEQNKFLSALSKSQKKVVKYLLFSSSSFGAIMVLFLGIYSFGFFYGKQLIIWKIGDMQTVMSTFFCFLIGGATVSQISPIMKNIAEGKVAAGSLYYLLQRKKTLIQPQIGTQIKQVQSISFEDVTFRYQKVQNEVKEQQQSKIKQKQQKPSQNTQQILARSQGHLQQPKLQNNITSNTVLDSISLKFNKGKVTAIVGESGSGKSTIIQLLLRYYDPTQGSILINQHQMKNIDIKGFRRKVGYVGQQPMLFSMSIAQNLRLSNPQLTDDEIKSILTKANALQFVQKCQSGINTYVGSSGTQLSGGQKQRIAIARAIAKNPYLLVLDQATSALDRKNQKQIQKTLNNLSEGHITTIVVAHRLSTIRNADHIIVLGKGKILQQGTHQQLYSNEGAYFELVKSQMATTAEADKLIKINQSDITNQVQSQLAESQNKKQNEIEVQKNNQQILPEQNKKQDSVFGRLVRQSKGTYLYLIVGCLAALCNGLIWPGFNYAFSQIMNLMPKLQSKDTTIRDNAGSQINNYCLLFLGVAVAGALTSALYMFCFGVASQRLVFKLRSKLFIKLLSLPVSYYDKPGNTPGGISTKLSQDSFQINNMVTGVVGVMCLNISTVVASLILAFYHFWQLTLIVLALSPLMIASGAINMKVMKSMSVKSQKFQKEVGSLISDTVCNIRTVKSFGNEDVFLNIFTKKLDQITQLSSQKQFKSSFLQGLSRGSAMFVEGFTFWIAAVLIQNKIGSEDIGGKQVFIAIFSIIFAALGVGQNSQFMPDMGKARKAGASMFQILDSKDEVQQAAQMQNLQLHEFEGDIQFKNVKFKYPQRQAVVLKNFSLTIKKGDKIGFAGPSGSGKSTITQILMRFYPIQEGEILVDGVDYRLYNLHKYRKQIGLVSQQPTLFLGTVQQNVVYNESQLTAEKVQQYCKIVHAQDFINQWPQKYGKDVGQKGSQVSGGQKQRLALARCLIRQPRIMMLDESTSALDADTQKIVFNNLKPIINNCTCISIAHRLSTIEDSTRIIVMRDGEIIQQGNYQELMNIKQNFYRLAKGTN